MLATSLTGLTAARTAFDVSAHNTANVSTAGFRPQRVDLEALPAGGGVAARVSTTAVAPPADRSGTDLASETVATVVAEHAYTANAVAVRAQDEMLGNLVDILA